jgi:hypothetical protein
VGTTSSVRFNQEETDYVLGVSWNNSQEVVQGVYEKLEKLGLLSYKEYIVRNIRAYISNVSADKLELYLKLGQTKHIEQIVQKGEFDL